ncbi:MAG: flavocytochrome c [Firmicutes bacterium HGW-Firmicutes-19]|jgi:flavocytochrome c|nr:MAG: flavocytochrome c [Firmicutes bacterium HGW-Firmicutes-19]
MMDGIKKTDVLIVGSGYAGLSAAIEARLAGASVLIVEKMAAPGGNSIISDGGIAAVHTDEQNAQGITDSVELMVADMRKAAQYRSDPQLVQRVCEESRRVFEWTKDFFDMHYRPRIEIFGGHSVPRCHTPTSVKGVDLLLKMVKKCEELGIPLIKKCSVTKINIEDDRVIGVEAEHDGEVVQIMIDKALVIASGGFGADVEFRKKLDGRLDESVGTTNKLSADSSLLQECMRIGAQTVDLDCIQCGPWASIDEKGFGLGPLFGDYVVFPYGILISRKTSRRFVNELADRKIISDKMFDQNEWVLGLADAQGMDTGGWDLSLAIKRNIVRPFASLEQIADEFGLDEAVFSDEVSRYNAMMLKGKDDDFDKMITQDMKPITQPPFYIMRMWPKVHTTLGGLKIDLQARVLNMENRPILKLFAAGEVTGGIHGASRLGSCAITECLVMGRIAGQNAAK